MSSSSIIFEFQPKKIAFKAPTAETTTLQFNLLYSNKKISSTEPLEVSQGVKELNLQQLSSLSFDTKDLTNKYPIIVYVLYGQKNPAKKIILKRSQMMKKHELQQKNQFNHQENFESFYIFYEIKIKNSLIESEEFIKQSQLQQNKVQKSKNEESPPRPMKRPSMLQIGAKAERIRKSSYQNKQSSESPVKNETNVSNSSLKFQIKQVQTTTKTIPNLTLSKEQQEEEKIETKDVKINLFETFNAKENKQKAKNQIQIRNSHRTEQSTVNDHRSLSHRSHQQHGSVKTSHREVHHDHSEDNDHHSSHDSHHGHGESHSLSLKLKAVILMLIVGFLFLMYDALDDRFSRRVAKKENIVHHGHGHNDLHHSEPKKKKTTKKHKKVVTH